MFIKDMNFSKIQFTKYLTLTHTYMRYYLLPEIPNDDEHKDYFDFWNKSNMIGNIVDFCW